MLEKGRVATRLPAQNLQRARSFYKEKLGLEPSEERPGGLLYRCAAGEFALFESSGMPSGSHTQMAWDVDDIEATVADLGMRALCSRRTTSRVRTRRTESRTWLVTIRVRAGEANVQCGFAIAKAICWASARPWAHEAKRWRLTRSHHEPQE